MAGIQGAAPLGRGSGAEAPHFAQIQALTAFQAPAAPLEVRPTSHPVRNRTLAAVLLIVHLFVTLALIGVVLIQRSEGGGLGIGTSQGMGSFMSGRGTANLLTRATAILATAFMALSLTLALMNRGTMGTSRSILDTGHHSAGTARRSAHALRSVQLILLFVRAGFPPPDSPAYNGRP